MRNQTGAKRPSATEAGWDWRKRYRVWEANRRLFLYPENWVEPELRVPAAVHASLCKLAAFIRKECGKETAATAKGQLARRKGVHLLLTGNDRTAALVAAQTLAEELGSSLSHVDLSSVVSKYIGETEKNLRRIFDLAEKENVILLFDEADALFGKRSEVKDSHDRFANVEVNYLLQRIEEHSGVSILTLAAKTKMDLAFSRVFPLHIAIPPPTRRKT